MANVNHSSLTDPYLHEPKGVASATNGQVYVADGAGSGSWTAPKDVYTTVIADVSTAEVVYIPIPHGGSVAKVTTVLEGAITIADATVTVKNAAGSSMGTITVAYTGSAAGDVDTLAPTTNNTVADDSFITVETNGGSTDAQRLWVTVSIDRS